MATSHSQLALALQKIQIIPAVLCPGQSLTAQTKGLPANVGLTRACLLPLAIGVSRTTAAAWAIVVLENSQIGHFCKCSQQPAQFNLVLFHSDSLAMLCLQPRLHARWT